MAKVYPPVKMKINRTTTKGSPSSLGARGRSGTKIATQVGSSANTTGTAEQTRSTVGKSHANEDTKNIKDQKAKRAKAKMKKRTRAAKPSGATKASRSLGHLRQLAQGAKQGSTAAIALRVAERYENSKKAARARAAGQKEA